jgi:hypothetical protein
MSTRIHLPSIKIYLIWRSDACIQVSLTQMHAFWTSFLIAAALLANVANAGEFNK